MDTLGIGLIGCGQIARQRYLPLLRQQSGVRIAAVCTAHADTAREAAVRLGADVLGTTDVTELVNHPGVQAVIVASPHKFHARQATDALRVGRHVLVEKPMATRWQEAEELVAAAAASKCVAMVLPYEHVAQLDAMLGCLTPEIVGRIVAIDADFSGSGAPPGSDWKYSLEQSGGGVLVAHAVYALDLIASIMGPALRVSAAANTLLPERALPGGRTVRSDIEDNVVVTLEYATGQFATVRSCWAYPGRERRLTIQGTRRRLAMTPAGILLDPPRDSIGGGGVRNQGVRPDPMHAETIPVGKESENIVAHFLSCIRTGAQPRANIRQAAHVTEQMLRAYDAARTGTAQTLVTRFEPLGVRPHSVSL
ncbi:MAG: Gfo/Idh/MocA family oxidoreductase [Gammaproteobacteria bacterium]|nr:Gfo/Idh/MocA family oxidoreductase [Gammaproteobacteria bacterium]